MEKWTYRFEDITQVTNPAGAVKQREVTEVNNLGRQGWELVAIFEYTGRVWAAFKHPIETGRVKGVVEAAKKSARGVDVR